ncbi:hypothetical protein GT360_16575 [Vibrio astriarenae]|uniref:Uncharacterized protein n=1 Tax=Vibrio astriarenae TaxID=1481923 RepID=A0A7Z2T6H2_9VIBR|nr:hypothetical protein [Vibrio astriarenae]QIA65170.1 hypothetical protein GT360_16575 [Vibrio astriarenae]
MHSDYYNQVSSRKSCLDDSSTSNDEIRELTNIWFQEGFQRLKRQENKNSIEQKVRYESTILFLLKCPDYRKAFSQVISIWPHCDVSKSELNRLLLLSDPELERN